VEVRGIGTFEQKCQPQNQSIWTIGQKVRLALARAVYADKPIYLLDDSFAALDRTVARFVYEQCIERALRATGKLVILCTHHEQYLANADLVIRLGGDGEVEQMGEL
jgi:ABC-type transport system involved in cytochrome bd biosynthesis fused ATPase/permease subunit